MNLKLGRRSFLSVLGAAGASLFGAGKLSALAPAPTPTAGAGHGLTGSMTSPGLPLVDGHVIVPITKGLGSTGNIWAELGVTPVVNSGGTVTVIGGSVMKPEVIEAIRMGNEHFCSLDDLELKAGRWMADKCKAPAGMTGLVTGGAAAALLVGYAGMLTEDYQERLTSIPDLRNFPKSEVIIQATHRYPFDHQIRQTGVKLVVVRGRDEMIAAINPRTLAIHFTNILSANGVTGPETVAIAKQHNVYTFNDASADVPPKERLWEYPAIGFDMTTFSGGKDICGPQASGLLIGKEDLIKWALLNMSPQEDRIGRVCKVGKETIFGLLKAVEMFVDQDYNETLRKYDAKAKVITNALAKFGVTANPRQFYLDQGTPAPLGNVSPHYSWTWAPEKVNITSQQISAGLVATKPVAIGGAGGSGGMSGRPDPNWPAGAPDNAGREERAAPAGGAAAAGGRGAGGRGGRGGAAGAAAAGGSPVAPAAAAAAAGGPAGAAPAAARGGRGGGPNSFSIGIWLLKDGEEKYIANRLVELFTEAAVKPTSTKPAAKAAAPAAKKS